MTCKSVLIESWDTLPSKGSGYGKESVKITEKEWPEQQEQELECVVSWKPMERSVQG